MDVSIPKAHLTEEQKAKAFDLLYAGGFDWLGALRNCARHFRGAADSDFLKVLPEILADQAAAEIIVRDAQENGEL